VCVCNIHTHASQESYGIATISWLVRSMFFLQHMGLVCRALLQKRRLFSGSLLIVSAILTKQTPFRLIISKVKRKIKKEKVINKIKENQVKYTHTYQPRIIWGGNDYWALQKNMSLWQHISLFRTALLQKEPIFPGSLLIVATPLV